MTTKITSHSKDNEKDFELEEARHYEEAEDTKQDFYKNWGEN